MEVVEKHWSANLTFMNEFMEKLCVIDADIWQ